MIAFRQRDELHSICRKNDSKPIQFMEATCLVKYRVCYTGLTQHAPCNMLVIHCIFDGYSAKLGSWNASSRSRLKLPLTKMRTTSLAMLHITIVHLFVAGRVIFIRGHRFLMCACFARCSSDHSIRTNAQISLIF